jgi:hypothetical protein
MQCLIFDVLRIPKLCRIDHAADKTRAIAVSQ